MKTLTQQVEVKLYRSSLDFERKVCTLSIHDPVHKVTSIVDFEGKLTDAGRKTFYLNYLNNEKESMVVTWSIGEVVAISSIGGIEYYIK